jgi:hypothetical protein
MAPQAGGYGPDASTLPFFFPSSSSFVEPGLLQYSCSIARYFSFSENPVSTLFSSPEHLLVKHACPPP